MTPEEQKVFDAVQAEKREIGIVDETEEKTEEDKSSEESTEEKDKPEEKNESEESEEDDSDSEDDSKDEKSDDEDEDEADDKESDDDDADHQPKQVSIKEHKAMKKALRDEIKQLKDEIGKKKPDDKKVVTITDRAKKLAQVLEFDESKVQLILEEARDAALEEFQSKNVLSEDDKKTFEEIKQQRFVESQEKIFNNQWDSVLSTLKAQYPNATEDQIKKAREEMDTLAHSEKHHTHEMDYILFKEKGKFDKLLFSPKQKTFESPRPSIQSEEDGEFPEFRPDMSPAEFEKFEKRRESFKGPEEKVLVRGVNPRSGRVEERLM